MTNTLQELNNEILEIYDGLKSGTISIEEAKARTNITGKSISGYKLQLDYNRYVGSKKKIPFLEMPEND